MPFGYSLKPFRVFSRRPVGGGHEKTVLVTAELLRGRQRHGCPSQTHRTGSIRVHTRVRSNAVR